MRTLDPDHLVRNLDGDPELLARMVALFFESCAPIVAAVRRDALGRRHGESELDSCMVVARGRCEVRACHGGRSGSAAGAVEAVDGSQWLSWRSGVETARLLRLSARGGIVAY